MKTKKQVLLSLLAITIAGSAIASEGFFNDVKPYVGIDLGRRNGGFKSGFGDNVFKKKQPHINGFVGVMFNKYFGLEAGYENTLKKDKERTLAFREAILGRLAGADTKFKTSTKISGFNLSLVGKWDLDILDASGRLSLLGKVGIKRAKQKFIADVIDTADNTVTQTLTFKKSHIVPKISGGIQYGFNERFAIRGLVSWEKTEKVFDTIGLNNRKFTTKSQNAFIYSIGMSINLM